MRKIILLATIAIVYASCANAQRRGRQNMTSNPKERVEQLMSNLDKQVDLTDEQEKQVRDLYEELFENQLSRQERQAQMEQTNEKVKALLTDEQKVKFDEMLNQQATRQKGRRK